MVLGIVNLRTIDVRTWLQNPNNIYIGRQTRTLKASKWANPYKVSEKKSREEAVQKFEKYIQENSELLQSVWELSGKYLGC